MKMQKTGSQKRLNKKKFQKKVNKKARIVSALNKTHTLVEKNGKFVSANPEIRIPKPTTVDVSRGVIVPELAHVLMNDASEIAKKMLYSTREDFKNSIFGVTEEDENLKKRIMNQVDRCHREIYEDVYKKLISMGIKRLHVMCKAYHDHAIERLKTLEMPQSIVSVRRGLATTTKAESTLNDEILYSIQKKDAVLFACMLDCKDVDVVREVVTTHILTRILPQCLTQNPIERTSKLNQFSDYDVFMKEIKTFIHNVNTLNDDQIAYVMKSESEDVLKTLKSSTFNRGISDDSAQD